MERLLSKNEDTHQPRDNISNQMRVIDKVNALKSPVFSALCPGLTRQPMSSLTLVIYLSQASHHLEGDSRLQTKLRGRHRRDIIWPRSTSVKNTIAIQHGSTQEALEWRHNERVGVSTYRRLDWLLNLLFRLRSKKTSKLRVTGICEGNSPVIGEFPTQRASNA